MNEQELIERMSMSLAYSKRLAALTNAKLADELMSVWAVMEMFTAESDVVSAAIDRLRGDKEKVNE